MLEKIKQWLGWREKEQHDPNLKIIKEGHGDGSINGTVLEFTIDGVYPTGDPTYKCGEEIEISGQYEILSECGCPTGKEKTCVKGEPFPPTRRKGMSYRLVDKTK